MGTKSFRSSGTQLTPRGANQGNVLVDHRTGLPIDVVTDAGGIKRLAVDASVTLQLPSALEVNLDVDNDGVHIGNPTTGDILLVNPDGSINANVKVDAKDGDNIALSGHVNSIFSESPATITTSAFTQIYTYTSTNSNTRIVSIDCTVSTPATFKLKINGNIKKILRSSSIERNITFKFTEPRPLLNGDVISIEAQVERLILVSYDAFTALEGYIG